MFVTVTGLLALRNYAVDYSRGTGDCALPRTSSVHEQRGCECSQELLTAKRRIKDYYTRIMNTYDQRALDSEMVTRFLLAIHGSSSHCDGR